MENLLSLEDAFKEAKKGNFMTHTSFCEDQSLHYYKGKYYYEDGCVITIELLSKYEFLKTGWRIKYIRERVNEKKLKALHKEAGTLMISGKGKSYNDAIFSYDDVMNNYDFFYRRYKKNEERLSKFLINTCDFPTEMYEKGYIKTLEKDIENTFSDMKVKAKKDVKAEFIDRIKNGIKEEDSRIIKRLCGNHTMIDFFVGLFFCSTLMDIAIKEMMESHYILAILEFSISLMNFINHNLKYSDNLGSYKNKLLRPIALKDCIRFIIIIFSSAAMNINSLLAGTILFLSCYI